MGDHYGQFQIVKAHLWLLSITLQLGDQKRKKEVSTGVDLTEPMVKGSKLRRQGTTVTYSKCNKKGTILGHTKVKRIGLHKFVNAIV